MRFFIKIIGESVSNKLIFEQIPKAVAEVSHLYIWGRTFQTSSAKISSKVIGMFKIVRSSEKLEWKVERSHVVGIALIVG